MKLRWDLVEKWLADVAHVMPWDAAVPGRATTDVSLRRLASGEAHRAQGKHHITIFLDISTFYEGIRHEALVADARELGFPMSVLHVAISVYQGPRLVLADQLASPSVKAGVGILAGCPIAPVLSKVALWRPMASITSSSSVDHADLWIDDISVDVVDAHPERAAEKALITHSRLKAALFGAGHNPSTKKTFFLASTKEGAPSLNRKRSPGEDPEVKRVGLDLGMATTGAGRRSSMGFRDRIGKAPGATPIGLS